MQCCSPFVKGGSSSDDVAVSEARRWELRCKQCVEPGARRGGGRKRKDGNAGSGEQESWLGADR